MIFLNNIAFNPEVFCATTPVYDTQSRNVDKFLDRCGYDRGNDLLTNLTLLHNGVRDFISYDVFNVSLRSDLAASDVISTETGFCLHKSILFITLCRRLGVPAVLCSDIVTNHVSDDLMRTLVGGDQFLHWYVRLHLNGKWVKAAPIFNKLLCDLYGVSIVEFDPVLDDIRQEDQEGERMHYFGNEKVYLNPSMGELIEEIAGYHPLMITAHGRTPTARELQSDHQDVIGGSNHVER